MAEVMEVLDPEVVRSSVHSPEDDLLTTMKVEVDINHRMDPQRLF